MRIKDLFEEDKLGPAHQPSYRSLADKYPVGNTQIWYARPGANDEPDANNLSSTHVLVGRVAETDPKQVYAMMQGDVWSPQGEGGAMQRELRLDHTSMQDGDVVKTEDAVLMVLGQGFVDLTTGEPYEAK